MAAIDDFIVGKGEEVNISVILFGANGGNVSIVLYDKLQIETVSIL
jgi:hypothetical protein